MRARNLFPARKIIYAGLIGQVSRAATLSPLFISTHSTADDPPSDSDTLAHVVTLSVNQVSIESTEDKLIIKLKANFLDQDKVTN